MIYILNGALVGLIIVGIVFHFFKVRKLKNEIGWMGAFNDDLRLDNEALGYEIEKFKMKFKKIESYKDLEVGKFYWLKSIEFGSLHIADCKSSIVIYTDKPFTLLGHWVTPENHEYTFGKYEIFGPIPEPCNELD